MTRKNQVLTAAVLSAGAFLSFASANAAPRDRNDRQAVREARKEVKEAKKDVKQERREARNANNPQERREERRDVKEAREDLRDARGDLRDEKRENNNGAVVYRNGRYYRNGQIFTGNIGGYNYNNGYRYNVNNGSVYYQNGRYYRNGQIFSGNYGGFRYNNGYRNNANNGHGYGNYNNQFRTIEGVVVVDNGSTNAFVIRTNNGARLRVSSTNSEMKGLSLGDVVRVSGRVQGANLYTNNVNIINNR